MKWNYNVSGWAAMLLFTLFACLWAYWGMIENFYEGWYYESLWMNLKLMVYQYLSPVFIFILLGLLMIFLNRWAVIFIVLLGGWIIWYYGNWFYFLPFLPSALLCYWGKIEKKKRALRIHLLFPLITLLVAGIEPIYRVTTRIKKYTGEAVSVKLPDHTIKWAQEGPGWNNKNYNWYEAVAACNLIDSSGSTFSSVAQQIWRLPSIEEAVRSMHRHGKPAGGAWNPQTATASYSILPDKEFPMWKQHSPIIYWWLSDAPDKDTSFAYMISANGVIKLVKKKAKAGYYGFRAVTSLD